LKILDAMAQGKAVVSTTVGCEGLEVQHGENILIADDADSIAAAVVRLFGDKELRQRLSSAARSLAERRYSWRKIGEDLEQAYQCAWTGACGGRLAAEVNR
jgi:glycosyltransferase involved in cell wall biosynthesis